MPLPDNAFDVVLCQLGLQFVADKSAALREMRRVMAPGGRVLVTTPPPNAFFDVLDRAMTRHVGSEAGAFVRMVFSLDDPAILLPWLANHAATRGGLRRGTVVTTGSWLGMHFVEPGVEVTVEFAGIGRAAVSFPVTT